MFRIAAITVIGLLALVGCEEEAPAGKSELSLRFSDFDYEFKDGRHRYNHDRFFEESGDVGVTVIRGRVCVLNGEECVDSLVSYRIEALQTLQQKGHHFATPSDSDRVTMQYWAKDDAGNEFEFEKVIVTDGVTATVE